MDSVSPDKSSTVSQARNATLIVFAANGIILASWLSRLPDIKQSLALSASQVSFLILSGAVGALIGLPISARVVEALGATKTVRLGSSIALTGIMITAFSLTLASTLGGGMLGLLLFGFGTGIWDVAQNLEGSVVERAVGSAIMPWFHAAFSLGTVGGALIGAVATSTKFSVLIHLSIMTIVTAIAIWWGTQRFTEGQHQEADHDVEAKSQGSAWLEPRTLAVGLMVFAAAFTEGTANDWLAIAFVEGHEVTSTLGVLGLACFLTFMTAGRMVGDRFLDRYGRVAVLRFLFGAAVTGSALTIFGSPALAYLGACIWGIGASLGFPVGMSAASDDPARAARRISVVATMGYTAFLAGPALIGFLGDRIGVLRALLAVGAACALALLVVPAAKPLPSVQTPA